MHTFRNLSKQSARVHHKYVTLLITDAPPYSSAIPNSLEAYEAIINQENFFGDFNFSEEAQEIATQELLATSAKLAHRYRIDIEEFTRAELDYKSRGKLGIGRYSPIDYPRMAAVLKNPRDEGTRKFAGMLIERALITGIVVGAFRCLAYEQPLVVSDKSTYEVWREWIPTIIDGIPIFQEQDFVPYIEAISQNIAVDFEQLHSHFKRKYLKAQDNKVWLLMGLYTAAGATIFYASCTQESS